MAYDLGATVPLGVTVTNSAGQPTNADTIALAITLPDGTALTPAPAVTNPPATTGEYSYDYPSSQSGRHVLRWTGSNPTVAFTGAFYVRPASPVALVSLGDVKKHLNIKPENTTDDEELRDAIDVASDVVEYYAGSMARKTITETHSGRGTGLALRRPPVISITSVTENGTTLDPTGYSLSDSGVLYRVSGYHDMPWMCGRNNVVVTYQAGTLDIPPLVLDSVKELVRINFRPQLGGNYSPFDSGNGSIPTGETRFGFFVPNRIVGLLQATHSAGAGIA